MTMVCGLDLHRRQITFDALEVESGQVWTGRLWQPDRERLRRWLRGDVTEHAHGGPVAIAVEGCTGWRYVVEEVVAAGFEAHVAEPADTQAERGRKRRAKTDRGDCRLLRELLARWPVAGVVDPADGGVGVARTGPAVQDVGRSALDVGATDPRRAVPARGDAAGDVDPLGPHPPATRRRRARDQSGRSAADLDGVSVDRRHHRRVATVEGRPATLRSTSAGMSGAGSSTTTGSVVCSPSPCGPSSATANASPAPNRSCATAAWTSPSTSRTSDAPAGSCHTRAQRRCAGRSTKRPRTPRINAAPTTTTTST